MRTIIALVLTLGLLGPVYAADDASDSARPAVYDLIDNLQQ